MLLAMVDVNDSSYLSVNSQAKSLGQVAWFEDWQPPGAQSAFIK